MNAGAAPVDQDSPAIGRAKAVLAAGRGMTLEESNQARRDLEAAGRGTAEHGLLVALLGAIERRTADTARDDDHRRRAAEDQKRADHLSARPRRWAALSPLARALHLAADESPTAVATALLEVVRLIGTDTTSITPPVSFEPPRW